MPGTPARGGYRDRTGERREHRLTVKLTTAERAKARSAAARAGMAPGAYAAQTLLDAAEYRAVIVPEMRRQMVVAMMQAAADVDRIGTNLDQAVAGLKASGVPGPELEAAARHAAQVIRVVEEAAQLVRRRLR